MTAIFMTGRSACRVKFEAGIIRAGRAPNECRREFMDLGPINEVLACIPPDVLDHARRGRTWPQQWVKFELNKALPVWEGFEEFRRVLDLPPSMELQLWP